MLVCLPAGLVGQESSQPVAVNSVKKLDWEQIADGIFHVTKVVKSDWSFRLQAFKVDLQKQQVFAVDAREWNKSERVATVKDMTRYVDAQLVVNGSYFDENNRPLGMVISEKKRINPFRKADWGVLYIKRDHAFLIHTRDWEKHPVKGVSFAIQVGPRIVVNSKPTKLKWQVARRSVIGILPDRKTLVFAVTDMGKAEANNIAELMSTPEEMGGFGCVEAVMMDGGPSSQLYSKVGNKIKDVEGGWPVPIGVAVREKDTILR